MDSNKLVSVGLLAVGTLSVQDISAQDIGVAALCVVMVRECFGLIRDLIGRKYQHYDKMLAALERRIEVLEQLHDR